MSVFESPEIQKRKVMSNEHAWAFPTYIPLTPGHLLVCPVRPVPRLRDLEPQELISLMNLVVDVQQVLERAYSGTIGFNIALNEGKFAGQSVPHVHVHVIPRSGGDSGLPDDEYDIRAHLYRTGEREPTPEERLLEISEYIKSFIM